MGGYWSQEPTSSGSSVTSSGSSVASSNILTDKLKSLHKASRTHKMVFVVNMALKMGKGKLAAQVGHAAVSAYRKASKDFEGQEALTAWENHGAVKIVVRGENTEQIMELHKKALDLGLYCTVIHDAGFTQVEPGSRTVLGIFGEKEKVDLVTGELKIVN